jgi:hypothetical protein
MSANAGWSGYVAGEYRGFVDDPLDPVQHQHYGSLAIQPEYRQAWDNGRQAVKFAPFARWDSGDPERTHADLRELYWLKAGESYEWRVGVRKVFWGVTESQHLVDVINQTDLVENLDGEDKLGQPMANLALIGKWGTIDLFALPYFRERTFPGREGRLRTPLVVDSDQAVYESGRGKRHVDWAVRWSHHLGVWDIGLSHFYGTSREPRLVPGVSAGGLPVLIPHYDLIHRTGLDLQATVGNWLWKLEAIRQEGELDTFGAATAGLEYTFTGVFGTSADAGIVLEYLYDNRDARATSPFQDDVMLGVRLALNDTQSSEALLGVIVDRDSDARLYSIEASRRLGVHWKLGVEARAFSRQTPEDFLYTLRRDDYLQVELAYYF